MSKLNDILRDAARAHIKSYLESNINDLAEKAVEKVFDSGEVEEIDDIAVEYLSEQVGESLNDGDIREEVESVLKRM